MARRFRGESVHKVDAKGRVSIPASFRRVLEEGDPDWKEGLSPQLVVVQSRRKKCLECFSMRSMEEIDDMVSQLPRFSREREQLERFLNTFADEARLDENGRVVLSQKLRDRIGLNGEALFAGMGDKFEIWQPAAFEADQAELDAHFESEGVDPFALLDRMRLGDGA